MYININGKFYIKNKAKVSALDRGFLYGDGIFETMRVYNGKIFALKEHIKRLRNSADKILLNPNLSDKEIETELYKTLIKNKLKDATLRISITRGIGPFGLSIEKCKNPTMVIGARKFHPYSKEFYAEGVSVIISKKIKAYSGSFLSDVKSANYLANIIAKSEIKNQSNTFEVLLLNEKGYVTEGTVSNFFIVKKGVMVTPPLYAGVLPGITREIVIKLAKESGIKTEERLFKPELIFRSEECFLTNTSIEILPITKVNGIIINKGTPGILTLNFKEKFQNFVLRGIYEKS